MQMNEEQFKLFCDFLDDIITKHRGGKGDEGRSRALFRNSVGLHQNEKQNGPWKAKE